MVKGGKKRQNEGRGKIAMPQSVALNAEDQAAFEEKVAEIKSELKKGTRQIPGQTGTPGVIYVGCIPRGFNEEQMEKFFSQFGKVMRLRISRSKKTGNPKGYAFVMFEFDEVAKIVVDTMNNYLMFEKLLKCRHVPAAEVHPQLFKGWKRKFQAPKAHLLAIQRHNQDKSARQVKVLAKRARKKVQKKVDKLAALGINYSIDVADRKITSNIKVKDDIPVLETPTRQVLLDDSSEDEIEFKTPPGSVRVRKAKSRIAEKAKTGKAKTQKAEPVETTRVLRSRSKPALLKAKASGVKTLVKGKRKVK